MSATLAPFDWRTYPLSSPPTRVFGSEGAMPSFSREQAEARRLLARTEAEAFEQFVLDAGWMHEIGKRGECPAPTPAQLAHNRDRLLPTAAQAVEYRPKLEKVASASERLSPFHIVGPPELTVLGTSIARQAEGCALQACRGTWVQVNPETLVSTASERAYGATPWTMHCDENDPDDERVIDCSGEPGTRMPDYWIVPKRHSVYRFTTRDESGRRVVDDRPYGPREGIANKVGDMCGWFNEARAAAERAYAVCERHLVFNELTGGAPGSPVARVGSLDEAREALRHAVDANGSWANELRHELMTRLRAHCQARQLADELEGLAETLRTRRREDNGGESRFVEVLCEPDLLTILAADMSATTASVLMQVLPRRAAGRADMLRPLRVRFPQLHIHAVLGECPHANQRNDKERSGEIYKNNMLSISISMVTGRPRDVVRREGRLKMLLAERDEHGPGAELQPLHEDDYGPANPRDPGYRKDEVELNQFEGSATDAWIKRRRMVRSGWSRVTQALDPEVQYTPSDPLKYFTYPPSIAVRLVHNDAARTPVRGGAHGGLEPQVNLREVDCKMRLCEEAPLQRGEPFRRVDRWPKPLWVTADPADPDDPEAPLEVRDEWNKGYKTHKEAFAKYRDRPLGSHIDCAILAKFWPECLATEAEGSKFRIVVTATGTSKKTTQPLTLTTETGPLAFVSEMRAAGTDRRKTKAKDKNKSPGASRATSPANKRTCS